MKKSNCWPSFCFRSKSESERKGSCGCGGGLAVIQSLDKAWPQTPRRALDQTFKQRWLRVWIDRAWPKLGKRDQKQIWCQTKLARQPVITAIFGFLMDIKWFDWEHALHTDLVESSRTQDFDDTSSIRVNCQWGKEGGRHEWSRGGGGGGRLEDVPWGSRPV